MKATQGNGGPGIVLQKGTVEKPEIFRGEQWIRPGDADQLHEDGTITFVVEQPPFSTTYHRVSIIGKTDCDQLIVDVRTDTVVTWVPKA